MTDRQTREATIRVAKAERSRTNRHPDRQTREVNIRVAKAERSRTNRYKRVASVAFQMAD